MPVRLPPPYAVCAFTKCFFCAGKRAETMYKGRVDIVGALKKLPNTRHQLDDLKVEAVRFCRR